MSDIAKTAITVVISLMTTLAVIASSWGKLNSQAEADHALLAATQAKIEEIKDSVSVIKSSIDILKYVSDTSKEKFITIDNRLGRYSDRLLRIEMENNMKPKPGPDDDPSESSNR